MEKEYLSALLNGYEPEHYLKPEMFQEPNHRKIIEIIRKLASEGLKADKLSVAARADESERDVISKTCEDIAAINSDRLKIHTYSELLKESFQKRNLNELALLIQEKVEVADVSPEELIRSIERKLHDIRIESSVPFQVFSDIIEEELGEKSHIYLSNRIASQYDELNGMTHGWRKGEITVIGARPGMGKTSLFANIIADAAVRNNVPTVIFDLENSKRLYVCRLAAVIENSQFHEIYKNKQKVNPETIDLLKAAPVYIDDHNYSISELIYRIRRIKQEKGVELVLIDNLQMIMPGKENERNYRERQIGIIIQELKKAARELNIAIIISSQLSRAVESRAGDKVPMLSDLRESGQIEQDSDVVIFLYRPAYYGFTQDPSTGEFITNRAELIVSKNRAGTLGSVYLKYDSITGRFTDPKTNENEAEDLNFYLKTRKDDFI
jgi:replicative DNA helicase